MDFPTEKSILNSLAQNAFFTDQERVFFEARQIGMTLEECVAQGVTQSIDTAQTLSQQIEGKLGQLLLSSLGLWSSDEQNKS